MSIISTTSFLLTLLLLTLLTTLTLINLTIKRLHRIFTRSKPRSRSRSKAQPTSASNTPREYEPSRRPNRKAHLLILLGSGGHTTEMLSILRTLGPSYLDTRFNRRTWVVSSGDGFSAARAGEFEEELEVLREKSEGGTENGRGGESVKWDIVTVRRARRVHQSLLTTPVSAVGCLVDCLGVLRERYIQREKYGQDQGQHGSGADKEVEYKHDYNYPDLILTNGPGTGVIMVLASLILLFIGLAPIRVKNMQTSISTPSPTATDAKIDAGIDGYTEPGMEEIGSMRSVYIESWARVKTLSLSGRILRFLAGRVLVQWRGLGELDGTVLQTRDDSKMEKVDGGVGGDVGGVKEGGGSMSRSMRIQRREGSSTRKDSDRYAGSIWPRKTEYIGAVVT